MSKIFHYVYQIIIIDHLHARIKEFINTLILATSRMDAVVVSLSVLQPVRFLLIYTFNFHYDKFMPHIVVIQLTINRAVFLRVESFWSEVDSVNSAYFTVIFKCVLTSITMTNQRYHVCWNTLAKDPTVSFHHIWKDTRRAKWLEVLGLCEDNIKQTTCICSRHFSNRDSKKTTSLYLNEFTLEKYIYRLHCSWLHAVLYKRCSFLYGMWSMMKLNEVCS